ncbi:MAG TPA: hypothetical protein VGC30_03755 [Dokdonella sp.]
MQRYANLSGESGIVAFEIGDGSLVVEFVERDGAERYYRYTAASAGAKNLAEMQRRARRGRGLATFIAQHAPPYADKWR